MSPKIIAIIATFILSFIGVVGDYFINIAGEGKKFVEWKSLILGVLIYGSTGFGWFYVMKVLKLSTSGAMYGIFTALMLTIMSVVIFKENITIYEIIGIFMAVISMFLLWRFA